MGFDVYPQPPTAPVFVNAATAGPNGTPPVPATSPAFPFTERLRDGRMLLRVVKVSGACAPAGPPAPTIRLTADTGDPVDVPADFGVAAVFGQPGGDGVQVAGVSLVETDGDDVCLVRFVVFRPGSQWTVRFLNHDTTRRGYVWVVADTEPQTRQAWIDVPETVTFEVAGGETASHELRVTNRGTGPLAIIDPPGTALGEGFALAAVTPAELPPNSCGTLTLTFAEPQPPGTGAVDFTVSSNDLSARQSPGHNNRIALRRRRMLVKVGDMLMVSRTNLLRVDPDTGAATVISAGQFFVNLGGVAIGADGHILVADTDAFGGTGAILRVDRFTGSQQPITTGGMFSNPTELVVGTDGTIFVLDVDPSGGASQVIRVDPTNGRQISVFQGFLAGPRGIALERDGRVLVGESDRPGAISRIDPQTRQAQRIAAGGSLDVALLGPHSLAVEPDGKILALVTAVGPGGGFGFLGRGVVVRVDPVTNKQQTVVSHRLTPGLGGFAVDADGTLLITGPRGTFRVDLATNRITKVSDFDSSGVCIVTPMP